MERGNSVPENNFSQEQVLPEHSPVVDIGVATIEFLSSEGLDFQTRDSLRRRDLNTSYPLTPDQTSILQHGMKYEPLFVLRDILNKEEMDRFKVSDGNEAKLSILQEATRRVRREAQERGDTTDLASKFIPKVGIRNIRQEESGQITFDTRPVSYKAYEAASKPSDSRESLELGMATGVSAVVRTKNKKLVLQYRGKGNSLYGDIPGASAAGLLDGEMERIETNEGVVKTGVLKPVTTKTFHNNILKEMKEEIAVGREHVKKIKTIAFADDKRKRHIEANHMIELDITDEELAEIAKNAPRSKTRTGELIDFHEKFIVIDEDDLDKLFALKTPLPPSHMTNFIAAGYYIKNEKLGSEAAEAWLKVYSEKAKQMYEEIDATVREYYQMHPEALEDVPPGKPPRNPSGYDPAYLPEQQGLPSFQSEVERVGLVRSYNDDMQNGHEDSKENKELSPNKPQHGWMFDADGVLFDTNSIKIEKPEIADFLFQKLQMGEPVAINTGRGVHFALDKILPALKERGVTNEMLERFMVVGEKGAVMAYFKDGDLHVDVDETISVPDYLREHINDLITTQFSDTMFEGMEQKASMLSPEKRGDVPREGKYLDEQDRLVEMLRNILERYGLEDKFRVDKTKIAVDVQSVIVGKHFAARKILDRWKEQGILPEGEKNRQEEVITAWGDSESDIEMAQEIARDGIRVKFIDVSETDHFANGEYHGEKLNFPIHRPDEHFSAGTASYMKQLMAT